jgi:hypothetical protein
MQRRHARWSVRMGVDERLFLEDGWSEPREIDGVSCRLVRLESAGLVVPLHEARPYRIGARLRASGGRRLRVSVNDRDVGALDAGESWADRELAVPAETLRSGRNFVRLRQAGEDAGPVAVAGLWLEPAAN